MEAQLDAFSLEACQPFLHFSATSYTRTVLQSTDAYEIVLLCWKRGQTTPVHDHPSEGCWMRILSGSLQETEYSYPDLRPLGTRILGVGDGGFKRGTDVLHAILALEDTVSIHLYAPPKYISTKYLLHSPLPL